MKKFFLVLTLGLLVVSSCKKEEKEPVTLEFLQGTWAGDTIATFDGYDYDLWVTVKFEDDSVRVFSRYIAHVYDTCYQWIPGEHLYEQYDFQGALSLEGINFTMNGATVINTNRSPSACDYVTPFFSIDGEIYQQNNRVFITIFGGGFGLREYSIRRQ